MKVLSTISDHHSSDLGAIEKRVACCNNSCRQVISNLVHGHVHSYLPNLGKDHTLLGLGEVSVQTTAKRIATCCSFLLDNLLFSNVIRFLDTAIFLLEDFISCWIDWQKDLAAKQCANPSISSHEYGEKAGRRLIIFLIFFFFFL